MRSLDANEDSTTTNGTDDAGIDTDLGTISDDGKEKLPQPIAASPNPTFHVEVVETTNREVIFRNLPPGAIDRAHCMIIDRDHTHCAHIRLM